GSAAATCRYSHADSFSWYQLSMFMGQTALRPFQRPAVGEPLVCVAFVFLVFVKVVILVLVVLILIFIPIVVVFFFLLVLILILIGFRPAFRLGDLIEIHLMPGLEIDLL